MCIREESMERDPTSWDATSTWVDGRLSCCLKETRTLWDRWDFCCATFFWVHTKVYSSQSGQEWLNKEIIPSKWVLGKLRTSFTPVWHSGLEYTLPFQNGRLGAHKLGMGKRKIMFALKDSRANIVSFMFMATPMAYYAHMRAPEVKNLLLYRLASLLHMASLNWPCSLFVALFCMGFTLLSFLTF